MNPIEQKGKRIIRGGYLLYVSGLMMAAVLFYNLVNMILTPSLFIIAPLLFPLILFVLAKTAFTFFVEPMNNLCDAVYVYRDIQLYSYFREYYRDSQRVDLYRKIFDFNK